MTILEKLQTIEKRMTTVSNAGFASGYDVGYEYGHLDGIEEGYESGYEDGFEEGKNSVGEVLKFTDVSSTAYRSIVPNGVEPFAKVNKIGGMSYKTRNLIPFQYDKESYTRLGLTATANSDGSITLKGTATEVGRFNTYFIGSRKVFFPKGTTFSIAKMPNATYSKMWWRASLAFGKVENSVAQLEAHANVTKTLTEDADILQMDINYWTETVGEVVDVTFYPMLNEGTTALPYEPYFEGLRSASVSELKSEFGNLFNYDNIYDGLKGTGENKGKIVINTSSFHTNIYTGLNGSGTRVPQEYWNKLPYLTKGTYCLYFDIDFYEDEVADEDKLMQARSIINGEDIWCGEEGQKIFSGGTFRMTADGYCYLRRYLNKKCIISNLMITRKPQTEYIPYGSDTLSVPEPIKSLEGYGLGVNAEYYNYIDFERKVFVQRVKSVDMGTLNWGYRFSKDRHIFQTADLSGDIQGQISTSIPINALSADYRAVTVGATWVDRDMAYGNAVVGYKSIDFVDNRYTDAETFQNAVAGKMLIYALETPIETDVSAFLTDEYIEVEGGGTITAVNEYGYEAPTNISYLIDTQGG